eukprot:11995509-Alexandrium_andersonii.AAC.1
MRDLPDRGCERGAHRSRARCRRRAPWGRTDREVPPQDGRPTPRSHDAALHVHTMNEHAGAPTNAD